MNKENNLHDVIFVTDKYGRRNKTGDIEKLQYDSRKDVYYITYKDGKTYPCRSADLQIIKNCLKDKQSATVFDYLLQMAKLFDYVIMDEASQVDVVTGAFALSCAKNAVIVGDKMQLPNVIEEQKKKVVQELFEKTKLPEGYNYINSFLASLEQVLPDTPQTLLREHYRCHPKIINFCNQQFYGGKLLIMTEDKGEADVLEAIKTTPGNFCKDHYNQRQIDVIKEEILPKYTKEEIANLGIIAPYNNQTDAIRSQIPGIDAATVHKYQGREKDNIIIATLTNIFAEPKYSKFSFVFEMPLKDVVNKNYIGELPEELSTFANRNWAHVDFTVFNRVTKEILFGIEVDGYNYHKKGTRQAERDLKKNAIFERIGLPLLRLSTKGSGEEDKIIEQLDTYLGVTE